MIHTIMPEAARNWDLVSEHSGPLLRLERLLRGRRGFTLVVLEFSDSNYRDRVIRHLDAAPPHGSRVDARDADGDFTTLEEHLHEAARAGQAIHLVGIEHWPSGPDPLWRAFNYHREPIAKHCPVPVLLWVHRGTVGRLATEAPDLWAWRSGVFDFGAPAPTLEASLHTSQLDRGNAPRPDRRQRIAEIDAYLSKQTSLEDAADLRLLVERGQLMADLGDLDAALEDYQRARESYETTEDRRGEALVLRQLADLLATRGNPTSALKLLREESLPVYEQLGDVRSRAITMGQIADILARRGDLDEALRIRREEELPVYEQLGDVRSRAITMGKIADILARRGDLDEALRIRREEELPVYEQLGDVRSRAITMAKIAMTLARQGHPGQAQPLLRDALAACQRLNIPEAEAIQQFLGMLENASVSNPPM